MCTIKPMIVHLMRGAIGIGLFVAAYFAAHNCLVCAAGLAVGGLVALGGCPACWLSGFGAAIAKGKAPTESPAPLLPETKDGA